MERLRTPEERFDDLSGFTFTPHYAEVSDPSGGESLRMAYIDEGPSTAAPFVLLHGEPSWSYLYRRMIAPLVSAGHRVLVPDLIGFGRSDKPASREDYTYERHVTWLTELLFDVLAINEITLFAQDWGSLLGLRLVGEHPERFARVAIGNGFLPTGDEGANDAFLSWQRYSQSAPTLSVSRIIAGGCTTSLADDVLAAYDAPFPDESFKEGARQFPLLVPTSPQDPAHDANVAAWGVLEKWTKPFLCCFSDGDPITRGGDRVLRARIPGTKGISHVTITDAGHFLQEDRGEELAEVLVAFAATP